MPLADWITRFLQTEPPRAKSLVMTVFGDTIAAHGGRAWLGSLIELMAPFGVNDRLLRTSVFRLVQEGWLVASRDGRRSAYAIEPEATSRFERANRRIYAALERPWDGGWTLLLLAPHGENGERQALRKELLWEGFGQVAPGVFAHPAPQEGVLDELLARPGMAEQLFCCRAADLPGVAARPLRELAAACWDTRPVAEHYRAFCAAFRPLLEAAPTSAQEAFAARTLLIHAYRRVQLHDPMLPLALLPEGWPGAQAYALARTLYQHWQAPAEAFVMEVLRREDPEAPPADAAFYLRFGGLE